MGEMHRRFFWIAFAVLTGACGPAVATEPVPSPLPTPQPTVAGVGLLPDTIPTERVPLVVINRPVTEEGVLVELIGEQVAGNRFLAVGDSIFAATSRRYGNEMCAGLEPSGWAVQVEAEAGRFIEFGTKVVNRLVSEEVSDADDDWDAAAVFLGTNYRGDKAKYEQELREILDRLAPRPTLLYTVTEYRSNWSEVNDTIDLVGADYDNVTIIDWGEVAKTPGVLRSDGLHPSDEGSKILVELTAAALGRAPGGEGECLRSVNTDDSAISGGNGTPQLGGNSSSGSGSSGGGSSGGGSSSRTTTTTTRPSSGGSTTTTPGGTPTTTRPGGTPTTTRPGGSPTTTTTPGGSPTTTTQPSGATTTPATTTPATTAPATTAPATTTPATTAPATTAPATTTTAPTAP